MIYTHWLFSLSSTQNYVTTVVWSGPEEWSTFFNRTDSVIIRGSRLGLGLTVSVKVQVLKIPTRNSVLLLRSVESLSGCF